MSSYALQEVIAKFIRLPEANRFDQLENCLDQFELTLHEKKQARALASDYNLTKFGHIMSSVREQKVTNLIKLTRAYLSDNTLREIWERRFEPNATKVRFNQLPQAFLEFLIEDEGAREILAHEASPFVPDMLRFELAQAHFKMKHFSHLKKLPEGSQLKHADFVVLTVAYDIQELRARLAKEKDKNGELVPKPRHAHLLFIRKSPGTFDCRIFEIDEVTKAFLQGELEAPGRETRPESYASLVELGLCHA